MARARNVEAELGAMRSELESASRRRGGRTAAPEKPAASEEAAAAEGPDAAPEQGAGDLAAALEDLRRLVGEYADSAEDLASDHPFAVAGAAFLLGFSIGRLSK